MTTSTKRAFALAAVAIGVALASPAFRAAHAVDGSGLQLSGEIIVLDSPPESVELGALESDDHMVLFAERQGHELTTDLVVDLSQAGDWLQNRPYAGGVSFEDLGPTTLSSGTRVDSYYVHYDNVSYEFEPYNYEHCIGEYDVTARLRFDEPILGIVFRADDSLHLALADAELGLPSVRYPPVDDYETTLPGAEVLNGCLSDRFRMSLDRRTLWVTFNNDQDNDNFRVIVRAP